MGTGWKATGMTRETRVRVGEVWGGSAVVAVVVTVVSTSSTVSSRGQSAEANSRPRAWRWSWCGAGAARARRVVRVAGESGEVEEEVEVEVEVEVAEGRDRGLGVEEEASTTTGMVRERALAKKPMKKPHRATRPAVWVALMDQKEAAPGGLVDRGKGPGPRRAALVWVETTVGR